jgi:uncharacterized protein YecT (DUF1311 family)
MYATIRPRGSILALVLLAGGALGVGHPARANAEGAPATSTTAALEACQRYATLHYQQASPERFASLQWIEDSAESKKYEDKAGSPLLATVLSGRGIWKSKAGAPSNVRFTCLLNPSGKPMLVDVAETGPRDPVDICWDAFEASAWGKMTDCLEASLKREEAALGEELTKAAQQAAQSLDKLSAKNTLQESNAQWTKYRDAECDRQQAFVAGRNHPDIGELTCKIRKTAERIADLRFDESEAGAAR